MKTDRDTIGAAIGRIPGGCSILTATDGEHATGVLVSWVQQASFEPLAITVCLKRGRSVNELVDGSGRFVLNVIGEDVGPMLKHFGKGFTPEEDAFAGLAVRATDFGPIIESCVAFLGCRVIERMSVGDHEVYAAEVMAANVVVEAKPFVHLRASGLTY